RADQLARVFTDRGVTYDFAGEERPFPLDLFPRVIDAAEWDLVSRGVRQRVKALEAFLADIYGPGRVFDDGVVPWSLIYTSPRFPREVADFSPPNGVRVHVHGIDLIRDEQGKFRVLEDNVRVPSGVSYVLANRSAMRQQWSQMLSQMRLRPGSAHPPPLVAAPAPGGAAGSGRSLCRCAHARRLQQRLLRTCVAGPGDGGRAGRGPRPDLLR